MSCAYRTAATRIATIATIPPDLMLTAMDIARQRRVVSPDLPPDRRSIIAKLLGITPTCGNPQRVIAHTTTALLILGALYPTHPSVERWMAIATVLGVPDDHLPVSVHPVIMATVRAQWAAPPRAPRSRRAKGIAALWRTASIPTDLIDEALCVGDRQAIVTWMAHGVWDDRFTGVCYGLTERDIGTIVRAGVVTDAIVEQVARWWPSDDLPWEVFPVTMWDRVPDPTIARAGRARTAATKLILDPTLGDDQLIAAAAEDSWYASDVLIKRPDLSDNRLIDITTKVPHYACDVLIARPDLCDNRLINAVATHPVLSKKLLVNRSDLRTDDRLITAVVTNPWYARCVLIACTDLSDNRLIAAVVTAEDATYAHDVLIARPDLRTDGSLLTAIARNRALVNDVLLHYPELRDHPIFAAALNADRPSA